MRGGEVSSKALRRARMKLEPSVLSMLDAAMRAAGVKLKTKMR